MKLAEKGCHVKLVCLSAVKRSHSVCAQGGINAAMNLEGEDDSPYIHTYDTLKGRRFLANQPPVLEMCLAAPAIINMLDRFGCPFNRTPEGNLDFRRFGGTLYNRTAFCGASTGQQLLYALDEQVRRMRSRGCRNTSTGSSCASSAIARPSSRHSRHEPLQPEVRGSQRRCCGLRYRWARDDL